MRDFAGRVAVVTGGAGGVGQALGARFAAEGMKIVLADVFPEPLEQAVAGLRAGGHDVTGVVTDVTDLASVEALADEVYATYGDVHVVCNNAGVGAGAEGKIWDHTLNDWGWGLAVNLWGVIHGIKAFVPRMLDGGDEGHVMNTSSGNGGIAPLTSTAIYATTKAAVTTVTEVLYGQLKAIDSRIGVSVLFPGPKVLRTGLLESSSKRPGAWANEQPRVTPYTTIESFEGRLRAAGIEPDYTPVEAVAEEALAAIREGRFWILPTSDRTDRTIRARAESMLERSAPTYLEDLR
ncbi:MAG TPA: SDR family NAD(P)-dependent oxidoreductase [Acidimicrobiales bacterium]